MWNNLFRLTHNSKKRSLFPKMAGINNFSKFKVVFWKGNFLLVLRVFQAKMRYCLELLDILRLENLLGVLYLLKCGLTREWESPSACAIAYDRLFIGNRNLRLWVNLPIIFEYVFVQFYRIIFYFLNKERR